MILLANSYLAGGLGLIAGILLAFFFWRWRERTLQQVRDLERQSLLDSARREAEGVLRESRLRASEEALNLRQETERSFTGRLKEITENEARLNGEGDAR